MKTIPGYIICNLYHCCYSSVHLDQWQADHIQPAHLHEPDARVLQSSFGTGLLCRYEIHCSAEEGSSIQHQTNQCANCWHVSKNHFQDSCLITFGYVFDEYLSISLTNVFPQQWCWPVPPEQWHHGEDQWNHSTHCQPPIPASFKYICYTLNWNFSPMNWNSSYIVYITFMLVITLDKIQIKQRGEGIALHAPSHGLQEVYMDTNTLKVSSKYDAMLQYPMLYDRN